MSNRTMPPEMLEALEVVNTLVAAGYEAFLVGGCVRDYVLGRPCQDYDITTVARPEQVAAVFPGAQVVGESFGVSLVRWKGVTYQVATYRLDGAYSDKRRPDSIWYAENVKEDLKRRDFTMNAMLIDHTGQLRDPLNGMWAIENKVVQCVGNPVDRFSEDALRMLRAVRFATQLGFDLHSDTEHAIREQFNDVDSISRERVRDELTKILTSGDADRGVELLWKTRLIYVTLPKVVSMKGVEQNPLHHPEGDVYVHTLGLLTQLARDTSPTLAWAALLHDVGKPFTRGEKNGQPTFYDHETVGANMSREILNELKMPGDFITTVVSHVAQHMKFRNVEEMRRSKLLRFVGQENFAELLELHKMDARAGSGNMEHAQFCEKVLAETPEAVLRPVKLVTGRDLIEREVTPGPFFRNALEYIETEQLEGKIRDREHALQVLGYLIEAYRKMEPLIGPKGVARHTPEAWQVLLSVAGAA